MDIEHHQGDLPVGVAKRRTAPYSNGSAASELSASPAAAAASRSSPSFPPMSRRDAAGTTPTFGRRANASRGATTASVAAVATTAAQAYTAAPKAPATALRELGSGGGRGRGGGGGLGRGEGQEQSPFPHAPDDDTSSRARKARGYSSNVGGAGAGAGRSMPLNRTNASKTSSGINNNTSSNNNDNNNNNNRDNSSSNNRDNSNNNSNRDSNSNNHNNTNNTNTNTNTNTTTAAAITTAITAATRLLLLRSRRFLWTFWRRREVLRLRNIASSQLSALLRLTHPYGPRLAAAGAVLLAGLFWFLVITTLAGPPGGHPSAVDGRRGSDEGGDSASGAGGDYQSYYTLIRGKVGVGPSLSDPWRVREIQIAVAEWGLGSDVPQLLDGGDVGDVDSIGGGGRGGVIGWGDGGAPPIDRSSGGLPIGEDGVSGGISVGGFGGGGGGVGGGDVGVGGVGGGGKGRGGQGRGKGAWTEEGGWAWDGRVNSVVTGELVPPDGKTRANADLLLTIFSGSTGPDAAKRELLRQIYDKHEGWVTVGSDSITEGINPTRRDFTVSVVFIMSRDSAPPEGELVGDILYVPVAEGYRNIVFKTKAMLCLVRHFDFKFLLKADDDSFVCLARIASMLHDLDPAVTDKVYAGVPTACNQTTNPDYWNGRVMKNAEHRWFDSKYVQHTLGGLDCFPVYMQGAFYILSQPLVEHLYRGHEHLECFTNEDVTIGSWLMGVDREMVEMYNLRTSHLWDCLCARTQITTKTKKKHMFFHNCKGMSQLKLCGTRLLRPGIGC